MSNQVIDSYVFKLKYLNGSREETRRYGFKGDLKKLQVYEGLYSRTAQVYKLNKPSISLLWNDLFERSINLNSHETFLEEVCAPTLANANSIKRDSKGRIELIFYVNVRKQQQQPHPSTSTSINNTSSSSSSVITKKEIKPVQKQSTETVPESNNSVASPPRATTSSTKIDTTPLAPTRQRIDELEERTRLSNQAQVLQSSVNSAPSTSSTIPVAPELTQVKSIATTEQDKNEIYSGVKTIFNKFVGDLNRHLLENLGDSSCSTLDYELPSELPSAVSAIASTAATVEVVQTPKVAPAVVQEPVHTTCYCDVCLRTIKGIRHKCLDCRDFDLCTACLTSSSSSSSSTGGSNSIKNHPWSNHTFGMIRTPGAQIEVPEEVVEEVKPRTIPTEVPAVKEIAEVVHPATCNVCDKTIRGIRYKCINCPDFDTCSNCQTSISTTHPLHSFLPIIDLSHPLRTQPGDHNIHKNIVCDHCDRTPIIGIRYKCTHEECPDFDLCSHCENLPLPSHRRDHILMKIREPISSPIGMIFGAKNGFKGASLANAREFSYKVSTSTSSAQAQASSYNPLLNIITQQGISPTSTHTESLLNSLRACGVGELDSAAITKIVEEQNGDKTVFVDVIAKGGNLGLETELKVDLPIVVSVEKKEEKVEEKEVESIRDVPVVVEMREGKKVVPSDVTTFEYELEEIVFDSTFIKDITLKDGSIVPAGGLFSKIWSVKNSGNKTWPIGTRIVNLDGFSERFISFEVVPAKEGEVVEIQCDLKAPEDEGTYSDGWRLQLPSGEYFGNHLWVSIKVPSEDSPALYHSSSTLSASALIAPSLDATGKAQGSPTPSTTKSTTTSSVQTDNSVVSEDQEEDRFTNSSAGISNSNLDSKSIMSNSILSPSEVSEDYESVHADEEEGSVHDSDEISSSSEESSLSSSSSSSEDEDSEGEEEVEEEPVEESEVETEMDDEEEDQADDFRGGIFPTPGSKRERRLQDLSDSESDEDWDEEWRE